MAQLISGQRHWSMSRDGDGQRTYKIKYEVLVTIGEGPAAAINCPGLPQPGDVWAVDSDIDIWAFCRQEANVTPHAEIHEGEPVEWFEVELTFSTKNDEKRCKDQQIEDPLLIPDQVSGSFVKYTEEARLDRNGQSITNSAHEQIRGPQVEFDNHHMTVEIEQNVHTLEMPLLNELANTVNSEPLWGCPSRCIKFTPTSWTKKYYGTCEVYYTRKLEFEINMIIDPDENSPTFGLVISGYDRNILDEGSKVLNGRWDATAVDGKWIRVSVGSGTLNPDDTGLVDPLLPLNPDPNDPRHFIRYKDIHDENTTVILDGHGLPSGQPTGDNPLPWRPNVVYDVGDTVWNLGTKVAPNDGNLYICILGHVNAEPPNGAFWQNLGPPDETQPGIIHVEKYIEADFTLLRIPLVI